MMVIKDILTNEEYHLLSQFTDDDIDWLTLPTAEAGGFLLR